MKTAVFIIVGYLAVNIGIWSLSMLASLGALPSFGTQGTIDPTSIADLFSINQFTIIAGGVGGAVTGILAMVTRSYALSGAVLLCWIVGVLFRPISDIFTGLPRLVTNILPPEIGWIAQIITAFTAFAFFIFIVEILGGRDIL